jgi:hypothetical protein
MKMMMMMKKKKIIVYTMAYPKVPALFAWNENCKWYSSLPLDADVSLFYQSA